MSGFRLLVLAAGCLAISAAPIAAQMTATAQNPLFTASTLPFQAPPFDRIKDTDYSRRSKRG